MSKVYVVQEQSDKNILSAQKYGEIIVLLSENKQIAFSAGAVTNYLKVQLSNFTDEDYLLCIGDPIAIGICTALATHWNNGKCKLLKWDRQEYKYFPVQISIFENTLTE